MSKTRPKRRSSEKNTKREGVLLLPLSAIDRFQPTRLPLLKEVLGRVYTVYDGKDGGKDGKQYQSYENAISIVAKEVEDHWINRNIYPVTHKHIQARLQSLFSKYRTLKNTGEAKRKQPSYAKKCTELNETLQQLFDVFCKDKTRREQLEVKYGVKMQDAEFGFLKSMRSDRGAYCQGIDTKYHEEKERKEQRLKKKIQQQSTFEEVSTEDIENEDACAPEQTDDAMEIDEDDEYDAVLDETPGPSSISTRLSLTLIEDTDLSERKAVHVRTSKRMLNNDIVHAFAELDGHGFSYNQSVVAMKVIGNRIFKQNWKLPTEKDRLSKYDVDDDEGCSGDEIDDTGEDDLDILPTRKAIRNNLKKMEAYSLKLVAEEVLKTKDEETLITHATDSTTRKRVGCFAPQGLHVNRDQYLPLPTLNLSSETTTNIAESIKTDFDILAAAANTSAEELYQCVDLHMTDSQHHNKGIAKACAEIMGRDEAAGQLFCNPHTALGFDAGIQAVVNQVETEMKMENIFKGFLLELDLDQKNDSVSLTFVTWILGLFGPDLVQKPWNYNKDFVTYMKTQGEDVCLFHMKDARFGCLSRCASIVLHHWDNFRSFLERHDYITNKLACLVRDAMEFQYIKIILVVVAAFGIQLIHPFFCKTKGKATHSELQVYFTDVYASLRFDDVDERFFEFNEPRIRGVSKYLFTEIMKNEYGSDVVESVKATAVENMRDF